MKSLPSNCLSPQSQFSTWANAKRTVPPSSKLRPARSPLPGNGEPFELKCVRRCRADDIGTEV